MKETKRTILVITIVMTVALTGALAFAHGMWGGRGRMAPGYGDEGAWNLPPEVQDQLQTQQRKFFEETAPLRSELYRRRIELRALLVDPSADPEMIKAKQREIFDLRRQFEERALDHQLTMREFLPGEYAAFAPWGRHGHMMGDGHHHGPGHMGKFGWSGRGGHTGGPCW